MGSILGYAVEYVPAVWEKPLDRSVPEDTVMGGIVKGLPFQGSHHGLEFSFFISEDTAFGNYRLRLLNCTALLDRIVFDR